MHRPVDVVSEELAVAGLRLLALYQCSPGEIEKGHEMRALCVSTFRPGIEQVTSRI
jgi:hypothetical protein